MAIFNSNNFESTDRPTTGPIQIQHFDVYCDRGKKLGTVADVLLDQTGNLRFLVVDLAPSRTHAQKRVLVPLTDYQMDAQARRVYLPGVNASELAKLPAYGGASQPATPPPMPAQPVYRMRSVEESAPLEASAPLEGYSVMAPVPTPRPMPPSTPASVAQPLPVQHPPVQPLPVQPLPVQPAPVSQSGIVEQSISPSRSVSSSVDDETIQLLEERVVVDRAKRKVGEVIVRKEIQTEIIEVPVQREKLIVEQVGSQSGPIAEIDLTEDTPLEQAQKQRRSVELPHLPE